MNSYNYATSGNQLDWPIMISREMTRTIIIELLIKTRHYEIKNGRHKTIFPLTKTENIANFNSRIDWIWNCNARKHIPNAKTPIKSLWLKWNGCGGFKNNSIYLNKRTTFKISHGSFNDLIKCGCLKWMLKFYCLVPLNAVFLLIKFDRENLNGLKSVG